MYSSPLITPSPRKSSVLQGVHKYYILFSSCFSSVGSCCCSLLIMWNLGIFYQVPPSINILQISNQLCHRYCRIIQFRLISVQTDLSD